jgi:hypothetical protein
VRRDHLADPEQDAQSRPGRGRTARACRGRSAARIGDHARGRHALLVVALEQHLVVGVVAVDLLLVHAQARRQRRHAAHVADLGERERCLDLPVDVVAALPEIFGERVAALRVCQIADHLEDLLRLVPRLGGVLLRHALERQHQPGAADAVAQRLQEHLLLLHVRALQLIDERLARPLVADLAEARRGLRRDVAILVVHERDQRVGIFGRGIARQHRRHQLAHARALVRVQLGKLVEAHEVDDLVGVERGGAVEPLHLR